MRTPTRLAVASVLGLASATALIAAPSAATAAESHPSTHGAAPSRAVFVLANDPAGNSVAVFDRDANGTLRAAARYATGGTGGVLDGSVVDHLASQGALTFDRDHRLLFAVNAGSNTVSVFTVSGDRLQRVQVVHSGGSFPVSVAVHGNLVYVLNARDGGSIQGYLLVANRLVPVPAWHRGLGLDPTAAPEFVNTPGEVAFTPRGDQLIVTTKANGNQIDVFNLGFLGRPSAPVVTSDPAGVPFAVAFDGAGRLDVSEAGPNAVATYVVNRNGTLTFVGRDTPGQAATCWIVSDGDHVYAANAGSASLSRFDVDASGVAPRGLTFTHPGTIDVTIAGDGHNLYVQTGGVGTVDEFTLNADGSLTAIGSVTVPGTVGGEGIAST